MIFLIGGNGLVGYSFQKYFKQKKIKYLNIQRNNQHLFKGKKCNLLIYANGNSNKTLAEKNPEYDFEYTLKSIFFYLTNIRFKKFIFFSSVDVYQNTKRGESTSENIMNASKSVYGINKIMSEMYVKKFSKDYLIFRLGGLVGDKLRKNPIYDIFNRKKLFTSIKSEMNFIHTDFIPEIIFKLINKKIKNETFNLASSNSITLKKILDSYKIKKIHHVKNYKNQKQIYRINTKKIMKHTALPKSEVSINNYVLSLNEKK